MGVIAKTIERELLKWPDVIMMPHRFGGGEFRVGRRELGHLHGDRIADLPFPLKIREELVASRRASPHHVLPNSGWVTYYIRGMEDVPAVIDLFRLNYERSTARRSSNPVENSDKEAEFAGGPAGDGQVYTERPSGNQSGNPD